MVLDTGDTKSMSNFRKHMKICWGQEAVAAADNTSDVRAACEALRKMELVSRSITAALKCAVKSKITYSHSQHTTTEARYVSPPLYNPSLPKRCSLSAEIICWIAENKRPFQIINDHAFQSLMKMGCPGYHIPSAETVSHDMKKVFVNLWNRIAKMLRVFEF